MTISASLLARLQDRDLLAAALFIDGQWREIDTGQDLERARVLVQSTSEWRV